MSFIDASLLPQEKVLYRTNLHWIVFVWPTLWLVLAAALFFYGIKAGSDVMQIGAVSVYFILFVAAGIKALVSGADALVSYFTSDFGVTDRRVLIKVGFIRRASLEVLLRNVEGIRVTQSVLGRLLDYGTVAVIGIGGSREVFGKVAQPLALRNAIQEQIAKMEGKGYDAS